MAQKKITDLQLRSGVTDGLNFPSDDGIQSYRVTGVQLKAYVLAAGNVTTPAIADAAVDSAKLKNSASVDADRAVTTNHLKDASVTLPKLDAALQAQFVPVGSVLATARATAASGFLLCDGSAVSRTTYADLFAAIGVTHGTGNGTTTFHLPDYRGRFLRGVAAGSTNDPDRASRTAMNTGANTGDNVGSVQGDAFYSHTHDVSSWSGAAGGGAGRALSSGQPQNQINATNAAGGNETRPKNAYVQFMIKY